jgi:hypothetical protein
MNNIIFKKYAFTGLFLFMTGVLFCSFSHEVFADAWWGEGYRPPEWVLRNGGTIIYYSITGANSTKKYKAMMFRDGEYVEVEFGGKAKFDDAKNGLYTINFYKCDGSCEDHKYDKKEKIRGDDKVVGSINILARPGQTNHVVFDAASGRAYIAGRSGGPVDPFIAQKKQAQEQEGNAYIFNSAREKMYRFDQVTYLSPRVDFEEFADINNATGITTDFNYSHEIRL